MMNEQKKAPAATEAKRLVIEQWQYTPYQIDALELGYKPRTVNLEKVRETVPHDLQQVAQFIVWQYQPNPGKDKPKKMPLRHNGVGFTNGSSTDKASCMSFEQALALYEEHSELDGIGFALFDDDGLTVVDLDDCYNGDKIAPWAQTYIDDLQSWTELTPSGKGFHVVVKADVPGMKTKSNKYHDSKFEMYRNGRYFTITGESLAQHEQLNTIEAQQAKIEQYNADIERAKEPSCPQQEQSKPTASGNHLNATREVLEVIGNVAQGKTKGQPSADKFLQLHNGGFVSDDQSADDMSYFNIAAFYTAKNADLMQELYFQSAIVREKSKREDYVQRSIQRAIDDCKAVFEGNAKDFDVVIEEKRQSASQMEQDIAAQENDDILALPPYPAELKDMPHALDELQLFVFNRMTYPSLETAGIIALSIVQQVAQAGITIKSRDGLGFNEYLMLLAPTGFGKEDIRKPVQILMKESGKAALADGLDNGNLSGLFSSNISYAAPSSRQGLHKILEDHPAQIMLSDEFAEWLRKSHTDGNKQAALGYLMEIYTKALGTIEPGMAVTNKYEPVENPRLSILATSTAEALFQTLTREQADSGAYNRWLMFVGDQELPQKRYDGLIYEPSPEAVEFIAWLRGQRGEVRFSSAAFARFKELDQKFAEPIKRKDALLGGRLAEQAIKIAGAIALADKRFEMTAEDITTAFNIRVGLYRRAAALVDHEGSMDGFHATGEALKQLKKALQRKPLLYRGQLPALSRKFKALHVGEQTAVVNMLFANGWATPDPESSAKIHSNIYKRQ